MVDGAARDLEGGISELRVTGGASRSDQFIQMHADILRRPLFLLRNRECTVLGASILGAVGCGYFASIDEAAEAKVVVGRTVEPEPSTADIFYAGLLLVFVALTFRKRLAIPLRAAGRKTVLNIEQKESDC